jgi:ribosomal protein S18 acetylase RimI-like enzyme
MSAVIRALKPEEAENVAPSLQRLISQLSSSGSGPDAATVAERVRDERVRVLVVERHGVIVGTATLSLLMTLWKGMVGHVDDVVVDATARGEGLGRRLLKELHEEAARLGLTHLDLTSRPTREAANALYQSLGYEKRTTNVYRLRLRRDA